MEMNEPFSRWSLGWGYGGVFSNDILKVLGARYFWAGGRVFPELNQKIFLVDDQPSERTNIGILGLSFCVLGWG